MIEDTILSNTLERRVLIMLDMLLFVARKYCIFTVICIYFLLSNEVVTNSIGTTLLGVLSIIALYNSVDMRVIYNTPDVIGVILIEMMIIYKLLF